MGKKLKIKRSITKRFKVTKTGKVMRGRQMGRHLRINKSKSQKRRHKEPVQVTGKMAIKIRRAFGV